MEERGEGGAGDGEVGQRGVPVAERHRNDRSVVVYSLTGMEGRGYYCPAKNQTKREGKGNAMRWIRVISIFAIEVILLTLNS